MTLEDIAKQISELRGEFSELRSEFSEMRDELSELHGDQRSLRGEFSELRGEFSEMRGELSELHGDQRSLRGEFSEMRGDQRGLRQEFATLVQTMTEGFDASKARDEELRSLMKFGLEAREVLRDEMHRRFDEAGQHRDRQTAFFTTALGARDRE